MQAVNKNAAAATAIRQIFVNLPVQDLEQSVAFFKALGFTFNPQFTDDSAACLILGASHYAMLIAHDKFKLFTPHARVDAHHNTEVLVALQLDSRAQVDEIVEKAWDAGGKYVRPAEDHGWMYGHAFQDLDGHIWEPFFMDLAAMQSAQKAA
ncbi:MAG: VOC family protein [Stenotrophobium sp.]